MKKFSIFMSIVIASMIIGFFTYVKVSNPLVMDGFSSTYLKPNDTYDITFGFYNEGLRAIQIEEVFINGKAGEGTVDLGISFDNLQLVQPGIKNPNTLFFPLQEKTVNPKLTNSEVTEALNKGVMTPLLYGIRVKDYIGTIETLSIQYKYLALTVTKHFEINKEFVLDEE